MQKFVLLLRNRVEGRFAKTSEEFGSIFDITEVPNTKVISRILRSGRSYSCRSISLAVQQALEEGLEQGSEQGSKLSR